jgi:hypothetical protein
MKQRYGIRIEMNLRDANALVCAIKNLANDNRKLTSRQESIYLGFLDVVSRQIDGAGVLEPEQVR